jgi:hypothetical protein
MARHKGKEEAVGSRARNDAYVMMLFIALVAAIGGSASIYFDNEAYGKNPPPKEKVYTPPKLG